MPSPASWPQDEQFPLCCFCDHLDGVCKGQGDQTQWEPAAFQPLGQVGLCHGGHFHTSHLEHQDAGILSMHAHISLPGSRPKSHHGTPLFSWCLSGNTGCVPGCGLGCVSQPELSQTSGCPCEVPACRVLGLEEAVPLGDKFPGQGAQLLAILLREVKANESQASQQLHELQELCPPHLCTVRPRAGSSLKRHKGCVRFVGGFQGWKRPMGMAVAGLLVQMLLLLAKVSLHTVLGSFPLPLVVPSCGWSPHKGGEPAVGQEGVG